MTLRIFQVPSSKHYAGRSGEAVVALVHHRMVGTLKSTDATFTTGTRQASTNFGVGYDCGRSGHPTGKAGAHVHQYVMVDDAAWGNGNLDASGEWDDVYGATPNPNFRTISIEHHDNGGVPAGTGKGVVPEEVLTVSIELDRLLLSGDWDAWRAAGITANTAAGGAAVAAQVAMIRPSTRTLVDHHYISGRLKPYCWRPWADDPTGFPQARYIAELSAGQEGDMEITAIKGEDWRPTKNSKTGLSNGVLRREPVVSAPVIARLPLGTIVRSIEEIRTTAATDFDWRATEILPAFLVHAAAGQTPVPGETVFMLRRDWDPLKQGGDPAVDKGLTDYIERKAVDCSDEALAAAQHEWDRIAVPVQQAIPARP